ncbi:hypothetical protein SKAU_G00379450 [Synaphobranchus kaupii]|uniref:TNFR-Cys domain-containing protein n=1 Tax=Synaphobranchus kaupii TaxID=118154 RepID=A0A9Q1EDC8_SYNKA|nr:hypothetical protein SKAU_G00379450 [Synaphobranchus kaupii]
MSQLLERFSLHQERMGVDVTSSWIIHIWIRHLLVCLCAQVVLSRPSCSPHEYVRDRRCCSKCKPGTYALSLCTSTLDTICRPCGSNEYQPDWNNELRCLTQKYCDRGRGFDSDRPENQTAAVPCRCLPGLQCSLVNCEFCERMRLCPPGYGLTVGELGRGSCTECRLGFFSNVSSATEPCRPWADCKVLGRAEKHPGTTKTDAVCGPRVPGSTTSWVIVAVLSVIIVLSLVVLFLVCCKDKLKSLTENVRTCVQDLKRNSMLQETALTSYDGGLGTQNCTLEITRLILQEGDPHDSLASSADDKREHGEAARSTGGAGESASPGDRGERSDPEPAPPPPPPPSASGSCSCVLSLKEPMEVGENEDCSQAVAPCSCSDGGAGRPLPEPPVCAGCADEGPAACPRCARPHGSCDPCLEFCGRVLREGGQWDREAQTQRDYRLEARCRSTDSTAKAALPLVSDCEQALSLHLATGDITQGPELEAANHTVAAGHVTGNNNTTFISNGQVMNFSGDVIVVYVSQDSRGDDGDLEEPFPSPVQEETNKEGCEGVTKPNTNLMPQENMSVF